MKNNGLIDIPLSCSFLLEPALVRFAPLCSNMTRQSLEFIHQWNLALLSVLSEPQNKNLLGHLGRRIIHGMDHGREFGYKCVGTGGDMTSWSLLYAIRFTESLDFLTRKQKTVKNIKFVDLGCGLSPMSLIAKHGYNISDAYCIDTEPVISDIYQQTSDKMGVRAPEFTDWSGVVNMAPQGHINTITSMGVFPYMPTEEQIARFDFIDKYIDNFLIEIKYNPNPNRRVKNAFSLKDMQDIELILNTKNIESLENTMLRNSLRYLRRFRSLLPNSRNFVATERSVFLSR